MSEIFKSKKKKMMKNEEISNWIVEVQNKKFYSVQKICEIN